MLICVVFAEAAVVGAFHAVALKAKDQAHTIQTLQARLKALSEGLVGRGARADHEDVTANEQLAQGLDGRCIRVELLAPRCLAPDQGTRPLSLRPLRRARVPRAPRGARSRAVCSRSTGHEGAPMRSSIVHVHALLVSSHHYPATSRKLRRLAAFLGNTAVLDVRWRRGHGQRVRPREERPREDEGLLKQTAAICKRVKRDM